jgi:rubrerythrin
MEDRRVDRSPHCLPAAGLVKNQRTEGSGEAMTIEEAIHTAIEHENSVRDVYMDASGKVQDPIGKKVFAVLAREEQGHVDFLNNCMRQWRETGKVNPMRLNTAVPAREVINKAVSELSAGMNVKDRATELEMLRRALAAEHKTSAFYKKMVAELPPEGQALFRPFVEIEEGHVTIVQAEMDALTGTGTWFDVLEISLEAG